jgi:hypothetical protein
MSILANRVNKANSHKRVVNGDLEGLSNGEREEVQRISELLSGAQSRVLAMAKKHCPQKLGHFVRAFSGRSRKAALLAEQLYLANYEAKMVDTNLHSSEPFSE